MSNLRCQPAIALSLLPSRSGSVSQCSDSIFLEGSTQIQIADCRVQISVVCADAILRCRVPPLACSLPQLRQLSSAQCSSKAHPAVKKEGRPRYLGSRSRNRHPPARPSPRGTLQRKAGNIIPWLEVQAGARPWGQSQRASGRRVSTSGNTPGLAAGLILHPR